MKRRSEELIDIDGKKYTRYECKQLQRKIEAEIRKLKDRKELFKAAGDDVGVLKANRKIRMLREKYDMITQKAGLDPHYDRMSVPRTAKSVDNSAKSDKIENTLSIVMAIIYVKNLEVHAKIIMMNLMKLLNRLNQKAEK